MHLLSLPNETLARIVFYLYNRHIETLAQTFNTTLTPICIAALHQWLAVARNERKMIAIFGNPKPWERLTSEISGPCSILYYYWGHQLQLGSLSTPCNKPVERLYVLDYLFLSGDLRWLQPVDIRTAARALGQQQMFGSLGHRPGASLVQMNALQHACEELELRLPEGFAQFMTSLELQRRILTIEWQWTYEPLIKLISDKNASLDGYMCKFFQESNYDGRYELDQ